MNRRGFLSATGALSAGALLPAAPRVAAGPGFKLGLVTYNIAPEWDLAAVLGACKETGFEAVELRTTHAHKIEPDLSLDQRRDARKQIADSGILLWGLGSVCEFHAPDMERVRKNIETCKAFCRLAADLGARGVKVRPNGLPTGVETEKTLEQIGKALRECGTAAADAGVEVWLEVHGKGTSHPPHIRTIMDHCAHKSVGVCWNSNPADVKDGSIAEYFDLLKKNIRSCHINELTSGYPYRELFGRLQKAGYDRVTLMEISGVPEAPGAKRPDAAIRLMRYYRALWNELVK